MFVIILISWTNKLTIIANFVTRNHVFSKNTWNGFCVTSNHGRWVLETNIYQSTTVRNGKGATASSPNLSMGISERESEYSYPLVLSKKWGRHFRMKMIKSILDSKKISGECLMLDVTCPVLSSWWINLFLMKCQRYQKNRMKERR